MGGRTSRALGSGTAREAALGSGTAREAALGSSTAKEAREAAMGTVNTGGSE